MEIPIARIIPLKGIRRSLANEFVRAYSTVPQVSLMSEIDVTELVKLYNSFVAEIQRKEGIRITYTHLMLKALAQALRQHPIVNSNLVDNEIRIFSQINIGMVVVTDDDLILAPVIHEVDKKSILAVVRCANDLAGRIRKGTFTKEDFEGGTFTLSAIGMFGGSGLATPLIVLPQTAILLAGAIQEKPVVMHGEIVIRSIMSASITFDHRAMTGVSAAKFMQTFADILGSPNKLELGI